MKNAENVKVALKAAIESALQKHLNETGTLKNLDWFNVSAETTDFYASQSEKEAA